jgi:hypothetical protein
MSKHDPAKIIDAIDDPKTCPLLSRLSAAQLAEFKDLHALFQKDPSQFTGKWSRIASIYRDRWKLKTLSPAILRANIERYNGS